MRMELLQPTASRLIASVIQDFYDHVDCHVNCTLLAEHVADVLDCQQLIDDSDSWLWDMVAERAENFEKNL